MKKYLLTIIFFLGLSLTFLSVLPTDVAQAAFNPEINYQGRLTTPAGIAVPNGNYNIQFNLYTTPTGGSPIWTENDCYSPDNGVTCNGSGNDQRVTINNGLFSVMLGSTTPITGVNFNQPLYLGVNIGGSASTPSYDGEMTPRKVLGAVPAAMYAGTSTVALTATNVNGVSSSQFFRNDIANSTSTATTSLSVTQLGSGKVAEFFGSSSQSVLSILSNGNIGIGSSTPGSLLTAMGNVYFGGNLTVTGSTTIAGPATLASTTVSSLTVGSLNGLLLGTNGAVSAVSTSSLGLASASSLAALTSSLSNGFAARWNGSALVNSLLLDNGTVAGINATSSSYTFNVQGAAGVNPFNIASSSGASLFTVGGNGNVSIGTSTVNNNGLSIITNNGNLFGLTGNPTTYPLFISPQVNTSATGLIGFGFSSTSFAGAIGGDGQGSGLTLSDRDNVAMITLDRAGVTIAGTDGPGANSASYNSPTLTLYPSNFLFVTANTVQNLLSRTSTQTLTGSFPLFNTNEFDQEILKTANATTTFGISNSANTLYIQGAPIISGSSTASTSAALYIDASSSIGINALNAYGLYVNNPIGALNNYAAYFGGNVGIGTTNPATVLEVVSSNNLDPLRISANSTGRYSSIGFFNNAGNQEASYGYGGSATGGIYQDKMFFNSNKTTVWGSGVTALMTLLTTGNVGIGTTTPGSLLTVQASTTLAATSSEFTIASSSGASLLTVLGNGNVGIGTTTPTSALQVNEGSGTSGANAISVINSSNDVAGLYLDSSGHTILYNANPGGYSLNFAGAGTGGTTSGNIIASLGVNLFGANNYYGFSGQLTSENFAFQSSNSLNFFSGSGNGIGFFPGGTFSSLPIMVATTTGVGIGTTTPGSLLTVQASTTLAATSSEFTIASSSGASLLTVLGNGNVSIGSTTVQNNGLSIITGNGSVSSVPSSYPLFISPLTSTSNIGLIGIGNSPTNFVGSIGPDNSANGIGFSDRDNVDMLTVNRAGVTILGTNGGGTNSSSNEVPTLTLYPTNFTALTSDTGQTLLAKATTQTLTGSFALLNGAEFDQNTIKTANATTTFGISNSANTLYIQGAPIISGSSTASTSAALYIDASSSIGINALNAYGLYVNNPIGALNNYAAYFGGNVGIGTTTPGSLLVLQPSTTISATSSLFTVASSTGTSLFTVLGNGNVGIGSSSPADALDVTGNGYLSGNLTIGNTLYTNNITRLSGNALTLSAVTGPVRIFSGNVDQATFGNNTFAMTSAGVIGFSPGDPFSNQTPDTAFSRLSAGVMALGNGTANSATGTLIAGSIGLGSSTPGSLLTVQASTTLAATSPEFTVASSSGASLFTVLGNGNVGIGTSSPIYSLVVNNISGDNRLGINANGSSQSILSFDNGGSEKMNIGWNPGRSELEITNGGSHILNVTSLGNVGIGTTTPVNLFVVGSSSGASLFTVLGNGNVGIGTTSPGSLLTLMGPDTSTSTTILSLVNASSSSLFSVDDAGDVNIYATTSTTTIAGGLNVGNGALTYDLSSTVVSAPNLAIGNLSFPSDSGIVNWVDMPVTTASASGTIESYSANLNGNPILTVGGIADGLGNVVNTGVSIGTSTGGGSLTVVGTSTQPVINLLSASSASIFTALNSGNVGIGSSTPGSLLTIQEPSTFAATSSIFTIASSTGTSLFTVLGNGNMGIGTSSPTQPFVEGVGGNEYFGVSAPNGTLNVGQYTFIRPGGTGGAGGIFENSGSMYLGVGSGSSLNFGASGGAIGFSIVANNTAAASAVTDYGSLSVAGTSTFSGNVGIGTTTPGSLLVLQASTTISATSSLFTVASSTGTSLFTVLGNGNVGIGSSSPAYPLTIAGNTYLSPGSSLNFDAGGSGIKSISVSGNDMSISGAHLNVGYGVWTGISSGGSNRQYGMVYNISPPRLSLISGFGEALTLLPNGNIGVGSTTPGSTLAVQASTSVALTSPVFTIASSSGASLLTVLGNGNVGIGTTTPASNLSIQPSVDSNSVFQVTNHAVTPVLNVDSINDAINIAGGISGNPTSYASTWGYDSSVNAGYLTFNTGAAGNDTFAIRRTNYLSSGDYTVSAKGNMQFSVASGKSFNFNVGNVGIGTTSPSAELSVQSSFGSTAPLFSVSTTTSAAFATSSIFQINANGNVGIGTTTPGSLLTVQASTTLAATSPILNVASSSGASLLSVSGTGQVSINSTAQSLPTTLLTITNSSQNSPAVDMINLQQNGTENVALEYTATGANNVWTTGVDRSNLTGAGVNAFVIANSSTFSTSPRFIINPAGNVAIGTSTASSTLTVEAYSSASATSSVLSLASSNGTSLFNVLGTGNVGIGTTTPGSLLVLQASTTISATSSLFTVASSTGTSLFTVLGNGNVGIGTTTPGTTLDVGGNITDESIQNCNGSSNALGTTASGTIVCNVSLSDARLKNNINTLNGASALNLIDSLNPVSFYWKDPSIPGTGSTQEQFGFIAQQVSQVAPNLVATTSPTYLTPDQTYYLNYQGIIAPLVSAVQEQELQINTASSTLSSTTQQTTVTLTSLAAQVDALTAANLASTTDLANSIASLASSTASTTAGLQSQITALASSTASTSAALTSSSFIQSITSAVEAAIQSAGNWVVGKLSATVVVTNDIQTQTLEAQTVTTQTASVSDGLQMTDQVTGYIYCVRIINGEFAKTLGTCSSAASTTPTLMTIPDNTQTNTNYSTPSVPISTTTTDDSTDGTSTLIGDTTSTSTFASDASSTASIATSTVATTTPNTTSTASVAPVTVIATSSTATSTPAPIVAPVTSDASSTDDSSGP